MDFPEDLHPVDVDPADHGHAWRSSSLAPGRRGSQVPGGKSPDCPIQTGDSVQLRTGAERRDVFPFLQRADGLILGTVVKLEKDN